MIEEPLVLAAEEAVQRAHEKSVHKKSIADIRLDLKNRYEKEYPYWAAEYILSQVYHKGTMTELANRIGVARTTLYNHLDQNITEYIDELKTNQIQQYEHMTYNLIEKALKVYDTSLNDAKNPQVRLKAAEMILKKFGIVEEKQKVEHSGQIMLPTINIVSTTK